MRTPLTLSAILHVAVLLIVILGLPHLQNQEKLEMHEAPIDVVEISSLTQAPPSRPAPPKPTPPKPPEPVKEPAEELPTPRPIPLPEAPKPPPPKLEPVTPTPMPIPDTRIEIRKPEPPKQVVEKPPEPKKEEKKPEPPKPEPKKEPEKKPEPPKPNFANVLQNVLKDKPAEKAPEKPSKPAPAQPDAAPQLAQSKPVPANVLSGDRQTDTEVDALRGQIAGCWAVDAGAKDARDLWVELRIFFDRAMRVTNVEFVRGSGNLNDVRFRAFAERAARALQVDACKTLRLPADKYGSQGSIVMHFNPRDMF